MYVPLISEITLENFLFGYLKEFRGQLMHLFTNDPSKEEMMIITMGHFTIPSKVIPAYEYHFYTISTFSWSNPPTPKKNQVHVLVIIVYVHLSYSSFSPYGKCDSDQSSFHHKSLEQLEQYM